MTNKEFSAKYEDLMKRYEAYGRQWLRDNGYESRATFNRDGIKNTDKWFATGNEFRPLFVLSEVHDEEFLLEEKTERFVDGENTDFDKGELTWRKIVSLSRGLKIAQETNETAEYKLFSGDDEYQEYLNDIAVINLKKFSGGINIGSDKSKSTGVYNLHINDGFTALLEEQIALINPTMIVCCGGKIFDLLKNNVKLGTRMIIKGYHPRARVSIKKYYDCIVEEFKKTCHSTNNAEN